MSDTEETPQETAEPSDCKCECHRKPGFGETFVMGALVGLTVTLIITVIAMTLVHDSDKKQIAEQTAVVTKGKRDGRLAQRLSNRGSCSTGNASLKRRRPTMGSLLV